MKRTQVCMISDRRLIENGEREPWKGFQMHNLHGSALLLRSSWIQITIVFVGLMLSVQDVSAQDYGLLPESELMESDSSWGLFWSKSRAIRYGSALTHCTRLYQRNIPAFPPVCHPSFGYHNPCWRQVPVDRRCQPCEIAPTGWTTESTPIIPVPGPAVGVPPAPNSSFTPTPAR